MQSIQVQLTKDGVLIPRAYLQNADDFEIEIRNGDVLVRPKPVVEPLVDAPKRYSWIGIAKSDNPNASVEVEEILEAEIDRRAGWTLDPYVDEA